jgi:Icc-related predicted phosphoesterase
VVIMRVHVVSDVHGRTDALAAAADGADAFFCLGDLLLFVDYRDHRQGIFPDLFGAEAARQYIELRTAQVAAVGEVDVLWAHIPPAVPELLFDTVAQRMERGSEALLDAVRRTQPRYVLFGHVHQPLARRLRIGRTECINVGHFRATGTPHVLAW